MRTAFLLLLPTILLIDCATLDKLPASTCGNGVVDSAAEDCDSFPADTCGSPESGESACRILCSPTDPAKACPTGWGCSVSGFCREPTGRFKAAGEPLSAGITAMAVGDFDGDRRKDIYGSSTLGGTPARGRVHYFGTEASVSEIVSIPASLSTPVVRDFDADGRDDIAFGYTFRLATLSIGGIGMLLGQADRAVVTKVFPSLTRPNFDGRIFQLAASADEVPSTSDPQLAVVATKDESGNRVDILTSLDADLSQSRLPYSKPLDGTVDAVVGLPAVGHLFTAVDANSNCGEVAVATNGPSGPKVQVFSPCHKDGKVVTWNRVRPPVDVTVPGETAITGVAIGDFDGDQHADLIVGGESGKVYVASGDGSSLKALLPEPRLPAVPLAVGRINSDDRDDFVLPGGVLMSVAPGQDDAGAGAWSHYLIQGPSKRWTSAAIADVNRDALPDVIGASDVVPDIDVLAETTIAPGGLIMPAYTISTTAPVTALAVSDVDFDSAFDVVFAQKAGASETTEIGVAFGQALAMPPEAPRIVGRLAGVRQLFQSDSTLTITTQTPGEKKDDLPSLSIAIMIPSGDRQPIAPLLFLDAASKRKLTDKDQDTLTRAWLVRGLLAAPVVEKNRVDLVALAGGYDSYKATGIDFGSPHLGMWVSVDNGNVSYSTPVEAMQLDELGAQREAEAQPVFIASDLENDGISETVNLSEDKYSKGTALRVLRAVPSAPTIDLNDALLIPDLFPVVGARASTLDVDGDGHLDIVTLLRDRSGIASVGVFFNDGTGAKRPFAQPVIVPLPKATKITDDSMPLDFTQVTVGGVGKHGTLPEQDLVIVAAKKIFRVAIGKDRAMKVTDATEDLVPHGLGYASSVVAGDFDGDGVEDLAISDLGSIRICRQKTRLP